jgi:hypothetical protein
MYKAIRSFKVQGADGEYRNVKPGESVPEAAGWKNLKAYLERKWICREDEEPSNRHYTARVRPDVAVKVKPPTPMPPAQPEPEPEPQPEPEPEVEPEPEPEAAPMTNKSLGRMSKSDLQELADSMGINPDQTKADLVAAILANA